MEREQAEAIMDNLESNSPWHERIPARLGIGASMPAVCSDCVRRYQDDLECMHCVANGGKEYNRKLAQEDGTAAGAAHYQGEIQPVDFMLARLPAEYFAGWCTCNVIKYAGRLGKKDDLVVEAKKIRQYAHWLVLTLEGVKVDPRRDSL